MGYTTTFKGELKFTKPLSSDVLGYLNGFLGKDRRDIGYESDDIYETDGEYWYHIDYELLPDFSGIKWNGAEKAYDMEHIANFLIDRVCDKFGKGSFGLEGKMIAQGEEVEDRWELVIKNGKAVKVKTPPTGTPIECPHCEGKFYVDEAEKV